jgi:hypothetical protein
MIDFGDIASTATGIGQICFFHDQNSEAPLLTLGFCHDGFWTMPIALVAACAEQARAGQYRLGFRGPAAPDDPAAGASILFQTGGEIAAYSLTAWGKSPPAGSRFLCVVGPEVASDAHGFNGCCGASDWHAAFALVRLLAPSPGLIGYALSDAISFLSDSLTWCETWRVDDKPTPRASESDAVWLGFSNRLLLTEVDDAASAIGKALPESVELSFHASAETTPTIYVDAMLARSMPGRR